MISKMRLDRFICSHSKISKRNVRQLLAQNRVIIDGKPALDVQQIVNRFSQVYLDGVALQSNTARYIMLNKPIGVVSATIDDTHPTVIDLIDCQLKHQLHIAGRLDLNSTGLILLTNDGDWSKNLSKPEMNISKVYQVTVQNPITNDYIKAFKNGMEFPFENIITKPVELKIINAHEAELTLTEGRYHQIKRMFGRFRNPVLKIHRMSIGNLHLDAQLEEGCSRDLNSQELNLFNPIL